MNRTKVNIGGDRVGSGSKMEVSMKNFERSTHNLSNIWRSTMAPGTLVPFMSQLALPGDKFDIKLNADVKTIPTEGPLFGSFKLQLDVFKIPFRLYVKELAYNKLNVGLNMEEIKIPQITLKRQFSKKLHNDDILPIDYQHINKSSLLNYLGISGIGQNKESPEKWRSFNAIPLIGYWDIYKNYYANKQEEIGAFINYRRLPEPSIGTVMGYKEIQEDTGMLPTVSPDWTGSFSNIGSAPEDIKYWVIYINQIDNTKDLNTNILSEIEVTNDSETRDLSTYPLVRFINNVNGLKALGFIDQTSGGWSGSGSLRNATNIRIKNRLDIGDIMAMSPIIDTFKLENIDSYREGLMGNSGTGSDFMADLANGLISLGSGSPSYGYSGMDFGNAPIGLLDNWLNKIDYENETFTINKMMLPMQGLALKTYQSDIFNNWISSEWIDGDNGINSITAIDTSDGEFTLDTLLLSQKVYNMLNRIAVSGGTYEDWIQAVWSEKAFGKTTTPVYMGGMSQEIVFSEVVSTVDSDADPLGTLAGRGTLSNRRKGGNIQIKVDEPSYIMGIVSITPRIDYSQGNQWDVNLKTMDDLHKPSLDGIGFQDLITEQMSWVESVLEKDVETKFSAGKQPAWINYMTNYNRVHGNFAEKNNQMFMVLNRNYEYEEDARGTLRIKDLTTYIDPAKYNYAFADKARKAQNFWVQIGINNIARRKISAKQIPNL